MTDSSGVRGMIAVDKKGCEILFLNPTTYETETVLDGFQSTVHELLVIPETGLAYVPIFGDGIHGRNPNPGHTLWVIDLLKRELVCDIDLSPYVAPHTVRLGADGLIYITCENSAVVAVIDPKTNKMIDAIDTGSTNGHRLAIAPDGRRLYTDNEEDATVSVIDLPNRKLFGKIKTPQALAGIAVSGDGRTVVAVERQTTGASSWSTRRRQRRARGCGSKACRRRRRSRAIRRTIGCRGQQPEQQHGEPHRVSFGTQTAIPVGNEPMDFAFRGDECSSPARATARSMSSISRTGATKPSFKAGTGCESVDHS